MKNAEYWENRFSQLEEALHDLLSLDKAEIEKQYNQTQQILDGQIALWYQRFADNNKITLAQAKQYVQGDALTELKWNVHEYIQYGKDNAVTGSWKQQLENASAKFHITKLEALKIQTQQSLENLYAGVSGTVNKAMGNIYKSGYYHTAFELQKGFGVGFDIASVDQSQLVKILSKPWSPDKYNFSERIWGYKNQLIFTVHNILTENIRQGSDPSKAIKQIAAAMHNSEFNAGRLVMTEGAYFSSLSQRDCFEELGMKKYEIVATLDDRTSEKCKNLDGKVFSLEDYKAGDTAPPFHCFCRSTTAPYLDYDLKLSERAARDGDGKTYYIPEDMNYFDWEKAFVNGDKSKFDLKVIEGTEHYSYKNAPAPSAPTPPTPQSKPKKTYLTKKKLIANIADAENKLDELANKLSGLTGDEAEKVKAEIQAVHDQKNEWEQKLNDKLAKEQKKQLIKEQKELTKELADAQAEVDKLDIKTYSGIWKDPVTTADYNNLNISGKKSYFESKLSSGSLSEEKKAEFENYLKQLEELEKEGKIYSDAKSKADNISKSLNKVTNNLNSIKKYGIIKEDDRYSSERKNNALWFNNKNGGFYAADKYFDPPAKAIHKQATSKEHSGFYTYTCGSGGHNRPLAGFEKPWSKSGTGWEKEFYKGAKNVWLDFEGKGEDIRRLTDLVGKSTYDSDVWLQSGQDFQTIEGFLEIPYGTLSNMTDNELQQYVGTKNRMYQFLSTAVNEGGGSMFNRKPLKINIYCPQGSQMLYASDVGSFGKSENEMILQRGGNYQITRMYWGNDATDGNKRKIFVDMELHIEDGYDLFQQDPNEWNGSKKNYKSY